MFNPAGQNFAGNSWHGSFPLGRGLPPRPNPLARSLPTQTVKADANGIQQAMAKRANWTQSIARSKLIMPTVLPAAGTGAMGAAIGHSLADEDHKLSNTLRGALGGAVMGGSAGFTSALARQGARRKMLHELLSARNTLRGQLAENQRVYNLDPALHMRMNKIAPEVTFKHDLSNARLRALSNFNESRARNLGGEIALGAAGGAVTAIPALFALGHGKAAQDVANSLPQAMAKRANLALRLAKSPLANAAIPASLLGTLGATAGYNAGDAENASRNALRGALIGGLAGAGAGAAPKYFLNLVRRGNLQEQLQRRNLIHRSNEMGREMNAARGNPTVYLDAGTSMPASQHLAKDTAARLRNVRLGGRAQVERYKNEAGNRDVVSGFLGGGLLGLLGASAVPSAQKKAAAGCGGMRRSSAGESGIKYKVGDDDLKKGTEAFKTLDNYMKKAGLNSFQSNFFSHLVQAGLNEQQIKVAVEQAIGRFGSKVATELTSGLEKFANPLVQQASRALIPYVAPTTKAVTQYFVPVTRMAAPAARAVVPRSPNPNWIPWSGVGSQGSSQFGSNIKNLFTGQGATTGAITGIMNPVTGMRYSDFTDDDGNMGLGSILYGAGKTGLRAGVGAAGGRLSYGLGGQVFGQAAKNVQNRALSGQFLGGTAGAVSDATGATTNAANTLSNIGYFGGAFMPGRLRDIPGLGRYAKGVAKPGDLTGGIFQHGNTALNAKGQVASAFGQGKNTFQHLLDAPTGKLSNYWRAHAAAAGLGGLGAGAYTLAGLPGRASAAINDRLQNFDQLAANANQLMYNANTAVQPFQQLGQFYNQNQGIINPLLGGLAGAGLGYAAGGAPGAAMGGMGGAALPMVMQMIANSGNNPYGLAGGGSGNPYQAQMGMVNQGAAQMPEEIARQKAYQASLMRNAASGYGR